MPTIWNMTPDYLITAGDLQDKVNIVVGFHVDGGYSIAMTHLCSAYESGERMEDGGGA